jgi:hypothetical protein
MKVSMDMDVAANPNPPDIRVSMDIHGFTHYVHHHNHIGAFQQHFSNNYMDNGGEGSGEHGRGRFD